MLRCLSAALASPDSDLLRRIITERQLHAHVGLGDHAFRRWQFAQMQTAWGREHISQVALFDGATLLASAARYSMSGVLDDQVVPVCAIGDLLSHAGDDGDRTTRALIEETLGEAEAAGAAIALLFSEVNLPWQRELQFQDITPPTVSLTFRATPRPGAPMLSIRAGEDRDLPAIAAMGQIRSAPFRFHLDRSVDFIQHGIILKRLIAGLGASGARELQFFVTEEGTIAAAYVVLTVAADRWTVEQCGDRDPTGARVGAILQALIARDPKAAAPEVAGWLPPAFLPPQAEATVVEPVGGRVMASLIGARRGDPLLTASDCVYWKSDRF